MQALTRSAVLPMRARPDVRAEQTSQEVLGSVVAVLERDTEWAKVRGEDGYVGWVSVGGLFPCDDERAEAWRQGIDGKPAIALDGVRLETSDGAVMRLPWGARIAVTAALATLPDGRSGRLTEGRWVEEEELPRHFAPEGEALVRTAREWLGTPYLWGGRTLWGADCSGLIQACFRLHGSSLPRDSYQQARVGEPIEPGADFSRLDPGDLVFFRASDSEHIVHAAISLGGPEIVHAAMTNGCVAVNNLVGSVGIERSLARRAVAARRVYTSQ